MAAAFARHLGGERVEVFSGGSDPAAVVNSAAAVAAMAEVGIDITGAVPREWTDEILAGAYAVITMGCGDECPLFPGVRYEDWPLDDPAGRTVPEIRPIRDEIRTHVATLLESLGVAVEDQESAE